MRYPNGLMIFLRLPLGGEAPVGFPPGSDRRFVRRALILEIKARGLRTILGGERVSPKRYADYLMRWRSAEFASVPS